MSIIVLAMTIAVILVEDRLPIATILLFALIVIIPAATVDVLVFFGPDADRPHDPLARSGRRGRRRGRAEDR